MDVKPTCSKEKQMSFRLMFHTARFVFCFFFFPMKCVIQHIIWQKKVRYDSCRRGKKRKWNIKAIRKACHTAGELLHTASGQEHLLWPGLTGILWLGLRLSFSPLSIAGKLELLQWKHHCTWDPDVGFMRSFRREGEAERADKSSNLPPDPASQPQQKACHWALFCKCQDPPDRTWITSVKPSQGRRGFLCFTALQSTRQRVFECLWTVSAPLAHAWCRASGARAELCRAEEVLAEGTAGCRGSRLHGEARRQQGLAPGSGARCGAGSRETWIHIYDSYLLLIAFRNKAWQGSPGNWWSGRWLVLWPWWYGLLQHEAPVRALCKRRRDFLP